MLEIAGVVRDLEDKPVARARIAFAPLTLKALPRRGLKGRYDLAQALHRARIKLPRTATDREGRWRVLLSPEQATLALGGTAELEMIVRAEGYATWHRAIGPDLLAAGRQTVRMEPAGPGLTLRLLGNGDVPLRGFVLIERSFRVRGNRTIARGELVPIGKGGEVHFAEPPRIPGEIGAARPTARAEGYRVTVLAAAMEQTIVTLGGGVQEVVLEPSDFTPRKILAERAEPARGPIEATYVIQGVEHTLTFEEAAVPLLGDEMPVRIRTGSGPVEIDTWDPDLPMFVVDEVPAEESEEAEGAGAAEPGAGRVILDVVDRKNRPLFGAGVWFENSAVKAASRGAQVFGMTGPRGRVELSGLPMGAYRVLIRHPEAGEREKLITTKREPKPTSVRLKARTEPATAVAPLEGTLLLDVTALQSEEALEVGMLTPGRVLARRAFRTMPRVVRLEGLVPGPTTFYLRRGEEPPILFGGLLTRELHAPARVIDPVAPRRVVLTIRDSKGQPAAKANLGLGDAGMGNEPSHTAALIALTPGEQPGQYTADLAVRGVVWLVVRDANGESAEIQISADGPAEIDVTLKAAPVEPQPEAAPIQIKKKGDGG